MTIVKRTGLGRAMTWSELDGNWDQVVESTAAAQQSAALAAASQAAAAVSETNAAQSVSDAASQAEAAGILRTDLASADIGKGLSLVSAEDGTNGQTFFENADQFAGAYESGVITITSANRWITYNGVRRYVKPTVTLPFTTSGVNDTSWQTDAVNFTDDPTLPYGSVRNAVTYYSPEMFVPVGTDVSTITDWSTYINSAINQARTDGVQSVQGFSIYTISSSVFVDNFSYGFKLNLGGLHASADWPAYTDWKKATPLINVGSKSNGSQVGLSIRLQYAIGSDVATMFQLNGYGCGGSDFFCGRARNFVVGYQCDNSTLSGSASNRVLGDYWYNGKVGMRVKRGNSTYIAEGHKYCVGFTTNMIYGAIQLFDGAQYFQIYGSDVDFNGKYLAELSVDKLPTSDIRGTNVTWNGTTYEVVDYYSLTRSTYCILVIDSQETTGGNSTIKVSTSSALTDANSTSYTISSVRTPTASQFYFDFIHGFEGAAFARGCVNFGYMAGKVGGLQRTSFIWWHNSFDENSNETNGLWIRNQSSSLSFYDKWSNLNLCTWTTTGTTATLTLPGQLNVTGVASLAGGAFFGSARTYGSQTNITLTSKTSTTVRTFRYVGDAVTTTKEVWNVIISGPVGLSGVGGSFEVHVGSSGIELFNTSGISYPSLSVSGFSLVAQQNAQSTMNVTFMFERK